MLTMILVAYVLAMFVGVVDFSAATAMLSTRSGASRIMRRRRFCPGCKWARRWARNASRAMRYAAN
jgi:hypothetical protein